MSTVDQAITLDLDDEKFDRLIRGLEKLPDKLYDKVVKRAAKLAVKPMMKIAKSLAPVRTGYFKKSIKSKMKTYRRNGTVVVVWGPENKKDPRTGENPANIAHLIEGGTIHVKPRPFMCPAYDLGRVASVERYRTELKKKFDSVVKSVS